MGEISSKYFNVQCHPASPPSLVAMGEETKFFVCMHMENSAKNNASTKQVIDSHTQSTTKGKIHGRGWKMLPARESVVQRKTNCKIKNSTECFSRHTFISSQFDDCTHTLTTFHRPVTTFHRVLINHDPCVLRIREIDFHRTPRKAGHRRHPSPPSPSPPSRTHPSSSPPSYPHTQPPPGGERHGTTCLLSNPSHPPLDAKEKA